MPVFQSLFEPDLFNAIVYQVTEPLEFFREKIILSDEEADHFSSIRHPARQKESFAARYALHLALNEIKRSTLKIDTFGKPYLPGTNQCISLSHTIGYVAALVSPYPCGIDIQRFDPKILKLGEKFLGEKELAGLPDDNPLSFLTHCWAIKEAAYKTFGKKGLEFRVDIEIMDLDLRKAVWECKVHVTKNGEYYDYLVKGWTEDTFVLAICMEIK